MNVLVTGGAGFIGSHLVDRLIDLGHSVRVIDNFSTGSSANLSKHKTTIEVIEADISEPGITDQICREIEMIFHFAAVPSVASSVEKPAFTQQNGEVLTVGLLQSAVACGVKRFILASSCSVYGRPESLPLRETAPVHPLSPYAASKAACEGYLCAFSECYSIETIALRYFNVFGPRQNPSSPYSGVLSIFLDNMIDGRPPHIFGDGNQTRDFVFVEDVVQANMLAMTATTRFTGDTFNIGSGNAHSLNQVVGILNGLLETNLSPCYCSERVGDIPHSLADSTRALDVLGYAPRFSLAEGLRKCLAMNLNKLGHP